MQPDLVWLKNRDDSTVHGIYDSIRGIQKRLSSDGDTEQQTDNGILSFNSDGFNVGQVGLSNENGKDYVAWSWKAGGEVGVGRSFMIDGVGFSTAGDAGFNPQAIPIAGAPNAVEIEPFKASISTKTGFSIVQYKGSDNDEDGILHGLKQNQTL